MNETTPSNRQVIAAAISSHRRFRTRAGLLVLPLVAAGMLVAGGPAQAATAGRGRTGSLTCQGQGVDPNAKLRHRTETFIGAPMGTIWNLQTGVENWPYWQDSVTSMKRLDPGPLRPGSRFRWTTPAPATPTTPETTLVITSSVHQVVRDRCIRWSGPAVGEGLRIDQGIHVWNFEKVNGGVIVRTEESWTGKQIEADPATSIKYLAPGLDKWLADLKATAEALHCPR